MIQPEELVGSEWAEWYRLTPAQRWLESEKLWQTYLALGGSLDPEPDTQSPFFEVFQAEKAEKRQQDRDYGLPLHRELEKLRADRRKVLARKLPGKQIPIKGRAVNRSRNKG